VPHKWSLCLARRAQPSIRQVLPQAPSQCRAPGAVSDAIPVPSLGVREGKCWAAADSVGADLKGHRFVARACYLDGPDVYGTSLPDFNDQHALCD